MTDNFEARGIELPADDLSTVTLLAQDDTPATLPETAAPVPNGFVKLGLAPELLRAVEDLGFTQPTQVQEAVIPVAMPADASDAQAEFIDLMVSSQTGSGKTAAFLLPLLQALLRRQAVAETQEREALERATAEALARGEAPPKRKRRNPTDPRHFKAAVPGALILCPTRELAQQVAQDAIDLVRHCRGLRVANVVGGIPYQIQIARLQNADLVVATPGRLLDLQRSMQIKLEEVQFLVVDEADRMLDLGFADDLAEIHQLTAARKQTLMFSATFAPRIQQLATRVMRSPRKVQIDNPQERHANIKQVLFWADHAQHKRALLDHWLRDTSIDQAIVFASTQIECDGLAGDLQQAGFSAVALHGALSQGLRNRRLMALRNGQVQILVATDVAARGIDVPTITHVFNYGLPMKAEDYTHRIGRTGRAGRDGLAVTFAEYRDRFRIFDIEGFTRQPFKAEVIPGMEPQQRAPQQRPAAGRNDRGAPRGGDRDRKFGGRSAGGFAREDRGFDQRRGAGDGYGRKPGFGDFGDAGARRERPAPALRAEGFHRVEGMARHEAFQRPDGFQRADGFARGGDAFARTAPAGKPARPGNGGKVFVPRDVKKRPYTPGR